MDPQFGRVPYFCHFFLCVKLYSFLISFFTEFLLSFYIFLNMGSKIAPILIVEYLGMSYIQSFLLTFFTHYYFSDTFVLFFFSGVLVRVVRNLVKHLCFEEGIYFYLGPNKMATICRTCLYNIPPRSSPHNRFQHAGIISQSKISFIRHVHRLWGLNK